VGKLVDDNSDFAVMSPRFEDRGTEDRQASQAGEKDDGFHFSAPEMEDGIITPYG
jgi:hypothetical protein